MYVESVYVESVYVESVYVESVYVESVYVESMYVESMYVIWTKPMMTWSYYWCKLVLTFKSSAVNFTNVSDILQCLSSC